MTDQFRARASGGERFRLNDDVFRFLETGVQTEGAYSLSEIAVPCLSVFGTARSGSSLPGR